MPTTIVPAPAFARAIAYNRETRDFDLLLDEQFVGTARSFYEGKEKLDALVYDQLQALRIDLADEAAAANANLDALEQSENEHADTLGAPEPDEPTPPDDDDLAAEGLRIASPDEAGWTWRNLWVTDAPPDDDEADEADEAEMEGMAYHAQRNAEDAAADEAAEQAADEAAAQAMDASMDMTCYCELCGGAVLPEAAALVGEQMACPDCAPSTANVGEAVDGAWRIIATEPAAPRLLWSWAGNAAALRELMDERHAAWFARQERMRVTAGKLGLLSREAK